MTVSNNLPQIPSGTAGLATGLGGEVVRVAKGQPTGTAERAIGIGGLLTKAGNPQSHPTTQTQEPPIQSSTTDVPWGLGGIAWIFQKIGSLF